MDCECVVGVKLSNKLLRNADSSIISSPTSSRSSSPSPSAQSPSSPSLPARTPAQASRPQPASPLANPPSPPPARPSAPLAPPGRTSPTPPSPPGFPINYRYPEMFKPKKRPEISVSLFSLPVPNANILTANHYALSNTFNDADLQPTSNQELRALLEIDPKGKVEAGTKSATMFKTSQGFVYEFGHGHNRCNPDQCMVKTQDEMANNCGYHDQFYKPYNFQVCGPSCSGALCHCLQFY